MIVAICPQLIPNAPEVKYLYDDKSKIELGIIELSQEAEKNPKEVISLEIFPRILLIIRKGVLISIEKEFIRLGRSELLRVIKRNLERKYLSQWNRFDQGLVKRIHEIFVDYNFELDKSVIMIVLRSNMDE
jgi:hypothetical protein